MMKHFKLWYIGFKLSFSYFSILPMPFKKEDALDNPIVYKAMLFFLPLVGFVLGGISLGLYLLFQDLGWYGAIISALVYMMLYGFLHLEAVSDVFDALYASHSGKDAYSIIKEPTIGAMGMLYTLAFVLLKIAGIVYLLLHEYFLVFISILIISRLTLLLLFYVHDFRSSFLSTLKASWTQKNMLLSFGFYTLISISLLPHFALLLFIGLVFGLCLSYYIKYRLTFINGDVMGMTLESVEILLFVLYPLFMAK